MKIICISGKAGCGKDAAAEQLQRILSETGYKVLITHFGDALKHICRNFFNWNGEKDIEGRSLLQHVGTDIVRKKNPDFWVSFVAIILKMFPEQWDYVLIPDTRFPNEIDYLRSTGIDVIHLRIQRGVYKSRLTTEQMRHLSETALDNVKPDYIVKNYSTLDALTSELERFVLWINGMDQIHVND